MRDVRLHLPLQHADRLGWFVLSVAMLQYVILMLIPWFSSGPWEAHAIRDDAFYQFAVARSLIEGNGFTLDGEHAAGGVQVLWTLLLAIPAWIFGADALPAAAILFGTLLHVLTAALLVRLVLLFAPRIVSWALAAYFLSRPSLVAESMNGQETALAMFVLAIWARRAATSELGMSTRDRGLVWWTVILPWARTDLLAFPAGLALVKLVAPLFGGKRRPAGTNEVALVASLAIYVVLQKICFGAWLPVSGFAVPALFQAAFFDGEPTFAAILRRYWWYLRPILLGGPYVLAGFGFGVAAAWLALSPLAWHKRLLPVVVVLLAALFGARDVYAPLVAAMLLVFTQSGARAVWRSREGRVAGGFWLGFILLLILHLPLRWYPRDYYLMPVAICGTATLAAAAALWLGRGTVLTLLPLHRRLQAMWIVVLLLLPLDRVSLERRFPWQEEMSFAARWAGQLFGQDAGIAAFNSGLLAWHHPGPVRNLDGVVDGASLPALRERRLAAWLAEEGMSYVLDSPRQVADDDPDPIAPHASGRYLGPKGSAELTPLVAFDLPAIRGRHPGTDCQMLFAVEGAARPALRAPAVLGTEAASAVVLLATRKDGLPARYVLRQEDRERPLRITESALLAPYVVIRIDGAAGRIESGGRTILGW